MSSITAFESIKGLVAFVTTVEAGSFAAAGRRLGLSPSAVGKAVGRVEARLGVTLLRRSTRSTALTSEGDLLYQKATRILQDVGEVEATMAGTLARPQGRLKVSMPVAIGHRIVVPALGRFAAQYPDIDLDVGLEDRRVDIVEEGFDLVIRAGAMADSSLIARKLAPHRFLVCGSPDYFARNGVPRTPSDLSGHRCLRFRYPTTGRLEEWAFSGSEPLKLSSTGPTFSDSEALCIAAVAGLGVVQIPSYLTTKEVQNGDLRIVLEDHAVNRGDLWLVWPATRSTSPAVRVFAEFVTQLLHVH
jgi:DNA-binding transcriptional LysR family regulator